MTIQENKVYLDMKLLVEKENIFHTRQQMQELFRKCEKNKIDPFRFLFMALQEKFDAAFLTYEAPTEIAVECTLCSKVFQKGENGWKGYKRFCKKNCTSKSLKQCT